MPRKLQDITLTPYESGVFVHVKYDNETQGHCRGNLPDALDLAHELLRPHATDDGAKYEGKEE